VTSTPETGTRLLLLTHPGIASALLEQARVILSDPMQGVTTLEVGDCSAGTRQEVADALLQAQQDHPVLVLTDLPGATPANLALAAAGAGCRVLSGLNLPMLIRAWNYRGRPLQELCGLVLEGGRKAVLELSA
jgi:PTS system ascorbate-specific IIA component